MPKRSWRKAVLVVLAGGALMQVGSCATIAAPIALSLLESSVLTALFGQFF